MIYTGKRNVSGPGLFKAEFATPSTVVLIEKKKEVRIIPVRDNACRVLLRKGQSVDVLTEGIWSYRVQALPSRFEANDGIPKEVAIPGEQPMSLRDEMKAFIRDQLSLAAGDAQHETVEEANDFDVEDDVDLPSMTAYEIIEMSEDHLLDESKEVRDNVHSESKEDTESASDEPVRESEAADPAGAVPRGTEATGDTESPDFVGPLRSAQ